MKVIDIFGLQESNENIFIIRKVIDIFGLQESNENI